MPGIASSFTTPEFRQQHLIVKLAAIMGAVGYVPKTGWNDFFRYKYVQESDLVAVIRPLLSAAGIMIIPNVVKEKWLEDVVPERNGTSSLCKLMVEYTVTDGMTTYMFSIPGYGVDKGDKSVYKALTGSMKYALMKLFLVETGDDPERESTVIDGGEVQVKIEASDQTAEKGGRSLKASRYQLQRISATMREKGIERSALLTEIELLFGVQLEVPDTNEGGEVVREYLADLDSEDAGLLLARLEALGVEDASDVTSE